MATVSTLGPRLLAPRSAATQRIWLVGECPSAEENRLPGDFRLSVRPDDHENFASLRAILSQLEALARPDQSSDFDRLRGHLREACPEPYAGAEESHGRLLADSVTFAIMRRISRESFYTARLIDLAAKLLNEVLCHLPGCVRVHVDSVDRLDRPSLKALARAVLLLEPRHGFSWIWHSASDPLGPASAAGGDLFRVSRENLQRQLVSILSPTLIRGSEPSPVGRPPAAGSVAIQQISAALVMQNYDACFLWAAPSEANDNGSETAERLRLQALAAINIGLSRDALELLQRAEERTKAGGRRAHLCYLQGLIEAKRGYDLSESNRHYERGLSVLSEGRKEEDLALERAWLLNGLALNESISWRRNGNSEEHFVKAFALERDAFQLVAEGTDPARSYLRFNLLANTAFLMEIQGNYELAIDTLERTFEIGAEESLGKAARWRSTLAYRIGVLYWRAGALEKARRYLVEAAQQDARTDNSATQERILRALGLVALDLGDLDAASESFSEGLRICRESRFAEGCGEHGRGTAATLVASGDASGARQVVERLAYEEGLTLLPAEEPYALRPGGQWRPSPPSPKLPAYFPEIDLEGIPATDLNRFLGKSPIQGSASPVPWRD